jgi:hypothetical protein
VQGCAQVASALADDPVRYRSRVRRAGTRDELLQLELFTHRQTVAAVEADNRAAAAVRNEGGKNSGKERLHD